MSVIRVENLRKSYRSGFYLRPTEVLKGVSFTVNSGSITGFLGGNGAGKTTTMKCLLGLCFPDSGTIEYFGEPQLSNSVKSRIGFLPEHPYFYSYLTGKEFLIFYGQISTRLSKKSLIERIEKLLKRVDLYHARDVRLRGYSKGMLQKIGLAQALIHEPEFVILDEPMSGLDPDGRMAMAQLIQETASQGHAVFFSSHLLHDVQRLCEKLVILSGGVVVFEGPQEELLANMTEGYEVTIARDGKTTRHKLSDASTLQSFLAAAIQKNDSILEVRPLRGSLEEAFIEKALRRGVKP